MLDVPFTVNLSLGTLNESLLLLKDQVKLLGLGNESTLHSTVKFDPILAPIEVLLLSMHFGASENIRVRILKLVVVSILTHYPDTQRIRFCISFQVTCKAGIVPCL